jgi:hypothetical protein
VTSHDPADLEEQLEIVAGRKAPYTTVPDWVTLHPDLDPQAKALYNTIAAHVNVGRGDDEAWPTRLMLAEMLGFSREQSVDRYIRQLEEAGAIDTDRDYRRPNGAKGILYIVHQTPPDGYEGPQTLTAWYKRRRAALAAAPSPKPGRPRKAAAAAAAPAAKPVAKPAAPPKKTAAKKTAAAKKPPKEKTPEQIALDKQAQDGAEKWWERAKELVGERKMGPLMGNERQKSGYFLNVRTRIREALEAGYDSRLIWDALHEIREWSPAKREFDRALRRLSGIPTGNRGRPGPLFRNDQWQQPSQPEQTGTVPQQSPAPPLEVFGIETDAPAE